MKQYTLIERRSIVPQFAVTLFLFIFPAVQLLADTNNAIADVQLHLISVDTSGELDAIKPVSYEVRASLSNRAEFIFIPDDRYLCQAELFDSNNIPVRKTTMGKQFGSLFDHLDANPKYIRDRGPFIVFLNSTNEIQTRRLTFLNGEVLGPMLPTPVELFDITNSGEYRMKLHFQFVEWTTNSDPHVVQLPIVEVKVHKR